MMGKNVDTPTVVIVEVAVVKPIFLATSCHGLIKARQNQRLGHGGEKEGAGGRGCEAGRRWWHGSVGVVGG